MVAGLRGKELIWQFHSERWLYYEMQIGTVNGEEISHIFGQLRWGDVIGDELQVAVLHGQSSNSSQCWDEFRQLPNSETATKHRACIQLH